MAGLAADYEKFKSAGVEVLAISVDPVDKSRDLANKLILPFQILSDPDHKTIDSYGVYDAAGKIAIPASFVLDRNLTVRWVYIGKDNTDRLTNDAILAEVNKPADSSK